MAFFAKDGEQWVVLDDQKAVLYSDPDRAKALAFFKSIATKPRGTCPHQKTGAHLRLVGTLPSVAMIPYATWPGGGQYGWRITDNGPWEWVYYWTCVTCGKEIPQSTKNPVDSDK